jgi:hypothetical protein
VAFLTPGFRAGLRDKFFPYLGSPTDISESLEAIFWVKNSIYVCLKYINSLSFAKKFFLCLKKRNKFQFYEVYGYKKGKTTSKIFTLFVVDGWKKSKSRIREKNPGSATLLLCMYITVCILYREQNGTPTKRQVSKSQVSKRPVSKRLKRQVYKTSGLHNVIFTKCQVYKTSGLRNVRLQKTSIYIFCTCGC